MTSINLTIHCNNHYLNYIIFLNKIPIKLITFIKKDEFEK